MKNPLLKSPKVLIIYFLIWLLFGLLFYLIMTQLVETNKVFLAADIFVQNMLFAGLLIGFWYPIHFMNFENMKWHVFILNQLLTYVVFTLIWINLSSLILRLIFDDIAVSGYLETSLPFKLPFSLFGYLIFVISMYFIKYYNSYIEKKEIENRLSESIKEAELTLLRNQMNPHFIFNSLNSISSLTIINPEKANEMVIKLSDFLRYTVGYGQLQKVLLKRELEMCDAYLAIEKIRFGDKIHVEFDIAPEALEIEIPSMLLQTIFENAIKHGIYNSLKPEKISFTAHVNNQRLQMLVENTFDDSNSTAIGTKTGLKNIKERLRLIYKNLAIFETKIIDNKFKVTIDLPINS